MSWDEGVPRPTDRLQDLGTQVRSNKTALRTGVDKHFFWDDSSGLSAGIPRLSSGSLGPGSARAFYGTTSQVSAYRDGALMVTSGNSRLYGLTSVSSHLLGATNMIAFFSADTITQSSRVLPQTGITNAGASALTHITFPVAYGGVPYAVLLTGGVPSATNAYTYALVSADNSGFTVQQSQIGTGTDNSGHFQWFSLGTVAL